METITKQLTKQEIDTLYHQLQFGTQKKTPAYAYWQIQTSECTITAYQSGKVVFQGKDVSAYANVGQISPKKEPNTTYDIVSTFPQCGSDEVGTGDYFGPVCVCACYVEKKHLPMIQSLNIQDSKLIKDEKILEIAPILIRTLPHSLLILDNEKYNQIYAQNNMVAIKCKLHNQAYFHLSNKLGFLPNLCVVDQFVQAKSYYRYLQQESNIIKNLHFETKAENKYFSVACASIIARYAFLRAFEKLSQQYQFPFLKGASHKVDMQIKEFIQLYGTLELSKVAKLHFANTKKAEIL